MTAARVAPPTVELNAASRTRWDAVVVGAGPAGAMAAYQLARLGARVLLLDKSRFPRPKVCGCCLNLRALAALEASGLGDLPSMCGAQPLQEVQLAAGHHRARVPLPGGVALSRSALDDALVTSGRSHGVVFLSHTSATLGPICDDSRLVKATCAGTTVELRAAVVLAADGLGAGLTQRETPARVEPGSRIGAGAISVDQREGYDFGKIYMACGRHGYVGLVRLEDGHLNLAAAFDASFVRARGGLAGAAHAILGAANMPAIPGMSTLHWQGTPALTRRAPTVSGRRLLVVGDAAGYVEPFTGEGIAWALTGGMAVAPLAYRAATAWDARIESQWSCWYQHQVDQRQVMCRVIAAALRHPMLMCAIIRALARAPLLAQPVVARLNAGGMVPAEGMVIR